MFERYAIFYTPPAGPLADVTAAWLGWDSEKARAVSHPSIACLDVGNVTATPRKYGFHGTLKAPFRLALNCSYEDLATAVAEFSSRQSPVALDRFELSYTNGFVALRPHRQTPELRALAAKVVQDLDPFSAPLTGPDIARRRHAGLSVRQDRQMLDWGYPYIFEDFNFHLTLSGTLNPTDARIVAHVLKPLLASVLPEPMVVDAITLVGQDVEGMFHQIHRYTLSG